MSINVQVIYFLYLALVSIVFFTTGFDGFFPSTHFFLIDYRNSINFPNFWDTNLPFYTVLPFNTLISLLFKQIAQLGATTSIFFASLMLALGIANLVRVNKALSSYFVIAVVLLNIPFLVGVYTGNLSVIFTVACFVILPFILDCNDASSLKKVLPVVFILFALMKVNLIIFFLYLWFLNDRNILKFIVECIKYIAIYFMLQLFFFYIVYQFEPGYSFVKIFTGFVQYKNDYIKGLAGFDFRCWLGSLVNAFKMLHLSRTASLYLIGITYVALITFFLMNQKKLRRVQHFFAFSILVFYLNVSMTLYWYTFFIPFLLYFFRYKTEYLPEILLIGTIFLPLPIVSELYTAWCAIFYYLAVVAYFGSLYYRKSPPLDMRA